MRLFVIWIGLIAPCLVSGQGRELDSLRQIVGEPAIADSVRLMLWNEMAYAFYSIEPDSGIYYAQRALELAEKMHHEHYQAVSWNNLGSNYWARGDDSLALYAYMQAMNRHTTLNNQLGAAKALSNMALIQYNQSEFLEAIRSHEEAISRFSALDHPPGRYYNLSNLGVVYLSLADYPKALETFFDALKLIPEEEEMLQANLATNIGLVYKNTGELDTALSYQKRAYAWFEKAGNRQGMANALGNMGVILDKKKMPEQALVHFKNALEINEQIGNQRRIGSDLSNMGKAYLNLGRFDEAYQSHLQAIDVYAQTNDLENAAMNLHLMGMLIAAMPVDFLPYASITTQNKIRKSLEYQQKGKELALQSGAKSLLQDVYLGLSDTYALAGNYESALFWHKKHLEFRDSVMNDDKQKELLRQQTRFEFDKKEAILKASHEKALSIGQTALEEQAYKKQLIAGTFAFFVFFSLIVAVLYKKKRDAREREKEAALKQKIAETEMKWLKAQLNPHFIFNSLNAISDFILKHDPITADYYLGKFARLMRMILEKSAEQTISLKEDLQMLEIYMQLESFRFNGKFSYTIAVDKELEPEKIQVPPLLLQPYVENSIWHGFSTQDKVSGEIKILIRKTGNGITFVVEDNGRGIKASANLAKTKNGHSMGMRLTEDRIAVWNQSQKMKASVNHGALDTGYRVELQIPELC
ncbi:Tetratricopeptide repeat-containing protein [Cyclobacterium lianum]|uniref:Tetratricopeptide repeat-containing protein n=1 Tax=Cyclobacterium lianum TaxID=388280 RepID=A0A1M7Q7X2_9BACT|nr:tetratricopeptide repeat protein [Cyclobacterium lianum]SHN26702.1 Tetratricopeptide repeat-containing protein [Cyclobacterium lianum]